MDMAAVAEILRSEGARFAFVFGSSAEGSARPESDHDVAAWFGDPRVPWWEIATRLPSGLDLIALDTAPLELAGRVALHGRLLFDDDPGKRVEWQATTRSMYLDEMPRVADSRRIFAEGARARGRR
jgi:predicted nucleotidyltransferase